ncbi:hypothetical protein AK830_g2106 [Neonectria ditissima]|uniref:Amidase domain-containing protein n=1 Tax=Neonectria ditissima TaxID=78410 RepID=A0A0P7B412_9HYPO|nr:hypothetical protein AK830_g2106 [Neonectria ditissima]
MLSANQEYSSISDLRNALANNETTVTEVTQRYLDAIEELNTDINCYVTVNENALEQAETLDALPLSERGPLFGVVIAVKDQIETAGIRTTFGSSACATYVPATDATVVRKLRDAGAVILGKTTMPDWATSWFSTSSMSGTTQNSHDLARDAGGSSSGSAAAVAAGLAVAAIGGDTGGSIRLPSSFCGLVGVRVTPGRISRAGMSGLVAPQDTPGPMTRTVDDAARILNVVVGFDEQDPETSLNVFTPLAASRTPFQDAIKSPTLTGKRLGVLTEVFGKHAGLNTALVSALQNFEQAGAELVNVSIPELDRFRGSTSMYVPRAKSDISGFLASRPSLAHLNLETLHAQGSCDEHLDLIDAIVQGPEEPSSDPGLGKCFMQQAEFRRVVATLFAKHDLDAIVYPTSQLPAPKTRDVLERRWTCLDYPTNTVIASQLLFPAISVPIGFVVDSEDEDGPRLPVGLELLGLPYGEEKLMAVAAGVEAVQRNNSGW